MPDRLTLSRAKGWKLPEGAMSVARPTIWGNPFVTRKIYARFMPEHLAEAAQVLDLDWFSEPGGTSQKGRAW